MLPHLEDSVIFWRQIKQGREGSGKKMKKVELFRATEYSGCEELRSEVSTWRASGLQVLMRDVCLITGFAHPISSAK